MLAAGFAAAPNPKPVLAAVVAAVPNAGVDPKLNPVDSEMLHMVLNLRHWTGI